MSAPEGPRRPMLARCADRRLPARTSSRSRRCAAAHALLRRSLPARCAVAAARPRRPPRRRSHPQRAARALADALPAGCARRRCAAWAGDCAGCGAAVELSSALTALHVSGAAARERARSAAAGWTSSRTAFRPAAPRPRSSPRCRSSWPRWPRECCCSLPRAPRGTLREWLAAAARPFGLMRLCRCYCGIPITKRE